MPEQTCFTLADGTPVRSCNPFFITGSGRCGTTLLRRLLIERTGAVIPPENPTLASSARAMELAGAQWGAFCRLVFDHLKRYSGGLEHFGINDGADLLLLRDIPGAFRSVANFWHAFNALYAARMGKPGAARWGDKTPANTAELPGILQTFPHARFVFLVRDVFDMAHSYGSMTSAGRDGQYFAGAQRWVHANSAILAFCKQHPVQAIVVRYEDLARSPEREMHRVLRHLDLPDRRSATLSEAEVSAIAAHPHLGRVFGEISDISVGKGRARLAPEVRQRIASLAGSLQLRFGYEPTGSGRLSDIDVPTAARVPHRL